MGSPVVVSCRSDEEETAEWNLRKCAAASMDTLAHVYKNDLLAVLLPQLNVNLNSTNWKVRESAILALGAIAEVGFISCAEQHLL